MISSTLTCSFGSELGSSEEISVSWLAAPWASTDICGISSDSPCSVLAGLVGYKEPPFGWLTVEWAWVVGSLDGQESLPDQDLEAWVAWGKDPPCFLPWQTLATRDC